MFDRVDYITVKEAAEKLGYSRANVMKLIHAGKLKAVRRGRAYLILPADIDTFVLGAEMFS